MKYIVYQITNIVNDKIYVGAQSTSDVDDDYLGSGKVLKRAIVKYGKNNFKKDVLFVFDNKEDMFSKEREIVNESFVSRKDTYNCKLGGSGGSLKGRKVSEETKKRFSAIRKGVIPSQETIEKRRRSTIGNPKLKSNSGKRLSEETKRKIGEASKGRNVGSKHSEETKEKLKAAWKRRKAQEVSIAKDS